MQSELKTLKDIRNELTIQDDEDSFVEYLKQEAIKWIKELGNLDKEDTTMFVFCEETTVKKPQYRRIIIKWIKHFFNITEEDLK